MSIRYKRVYNLIRKIRKRNKHICKEDFGQILKYGFAHIAYLVLRGHDVLVQEKKYQEPFIIGNIQSTYNRYVKHYRRKLIHKMRYISKLRNTYFSQAKNYYYFSLGKVKYKQYLRQKKTMKFFSGKTVFYKLLEECIIDTNRSKRIFRIEFPEMYTVPKFQLWNFSTKRSELIIFRPKTTRHRMIVEYKNMCIRYGLRSKHF